MLVKILKSEVGKVWSIIAPMIKMTIPNWSGNDERNMVNILESLLDGSLVGWFGYTDEEEPKLVGLVTTYFNYDIHGGDKTLTIYSLYGLHTVPKDLWMEGFTTLAKYAKANNCKGIIAHTDLENIKSIAGKLGADTKTTLIRWEI